MRLLAIIALVASMSSFASEYVSRKVSYGVFGGGLGSRTYYNCDSVEDLVEGHLETLGAINARVRCSGGIQWGQMTPVSVTASFDAPVPNGGTVEQMTLRARFDQNCELNTETLRNLLPAFPGVKIISKRDSCFDNRSRWSYDIEVSH